MLFNNVVIESFAYHLPERAISSNEIEAQLAPVYQALKLPEGRLELMSGIKERRHWDKNTLPSTIATAAAQTLLTSSVFKPQDIDLLIHASVCRDFLEPATASVIHRNLALPSTCTIFDLSNACLGVLNAMVVAANMIENKAIKSALIVSGENGGPLLEQTIAHLLQDPNLNRKNIKKYFANLTIGSAATAYLLVRKEFAPQGHQLLGGSILTDSSASHLCQGNGNPSSLMMETASEELMLAGIELARHTWEKTKEQLKWSNDTPKWIVTHQVGQAHEKLLFDTLQLPTLKSYRTYPYLGNTGSSALPITLAKLAQTGDVQKDDLLALLGIGSGLSSIMLGVKW